VRGALRGQPGGTTHDVCVCNRNFLCDCLGVDCEVAQQGDAFRVEREPVGDGRAAGREAAEVVAALGFRLVQASTRVPEAQGRLIETVRELSIPRSAARPRTMLRAISRRLQRTHTGTHHPPK
jgi:hypothetical protein